MWETVWVGDSGLIHHQWQTINFSVINWSFAVPVWLWSLPWTNVRQTLTCPITSVVDLLVLIIILDKSLPETGCPPDHNTSIFSPKALGDLCIQVSSALEPLRLASRPGIWRVEDANLYLLLRVPVAPVWHTAISSLRDNNENSFTHFIHETSNFSKKTLLWF